MALAAGASLAAGLVPRKPRAEDLQVGQLQLRSPPKALPSGLQWLDGDGGTHRVADYAGTGLVLNFWATWCGPCVAEMPSLARMAGSLATSGVKVIPVSTDAGGAASVRQFFGAHGIKGLDVWLDPHQAAMEAIEAEGLPTTLIIDRRGREVARIAGGANWNGSGTAATIVALCDV